VVSGHRGRRQRKRALRTGQVTQIFIDGGQFVIIHSSDRTPRHLFADFMAVGIDAGAHGGDELRKLLTPLAESSRLGPLGSVLTLIHESVASAEPAILLGQALCVEDAMLARPRESSLPRSQGEHPSFRPTTPSRRQRLVGLDCLVLHQEPFVPRQGR
jgi:hypothetical protein